MKAIEYRVRPVTRYIVTRFEQEESRNGECAKGGSSQLGEYDSGQVAYEVGYALCKAEHERLGWAIGDERIKYPSDPKNASTFGVLGASAFVGGSLS